VLSTAIVDNSENFCWLEALSAIVNVNCQECTLSDVDISLELGIVRNRENSTTDKSNVAKSDQHILTAVKLF